MNIRCSVHMIRKYVTLCRKKTPSEAKQSSKIKNYYTIFLIQIVGFLG